jgi:hypothetical protein
MRVGDRVLTPQGKGVIYELHYVAKGSQIGRNASYFMYAVKLENKDTVVCFEPADVRVCKIVYVEDRLTGTLYEMEVEDE